MVEFRGKEGLESEQRDPINKRGVKSSHSSKNTVSTYTTGGDCNLINPESIPPLIMSRTPKTTIHNPKQLTSCQSGIVIHQVHNPVTNNHLPRTDVFESLP